MQNAPPGFWRRVCFYWPEVDFFVVFLAVDLAVVLPVGVDLVLAVPLLFADLAVDFVAALPLAVLLLWTAEVVVQRWPRRQCVRVAVDEGAAAGAANGWPLASSSSYASIIPSS